MKLVSEERSVRFGYVSTGSPGRIQDSMPSCFLIHFVLDIEFISYLATLMKFCIARKPTFKSRSLVPELTSIGFLIKSGLFEQPLNAMTYQEGKL